MSIVLRDLALIDYVKAGDFVTVETLLDAGADPDAVDRLDGRSALSLALRGGHVRIARLLGERGACLEPDGSPPPPPAPEEPLPELPSWVLPLMRCYFEDGYVRRPSDPATGDAEAWEVRFVGASKSSFRAIRSALDRAGLAYDEPRRRPRGWMLTVPGRTAVERVLAWWARSRDRVVRTPS